MNFRSAVGLLTFVIVVFIEWATANHFGWNTHTGLALLALIPPVLLGWAADAFYLNLPVEEGKS